MICTKCFVKTNKVFVVNNYLNDYIQFAEAVACMEFS